jgi:hypothetical protein
VLVVLDTVYGIFQDPVSCENALTELKSGYASASKFSDLPQNNFDLAFQYRQIEARP